MGVLAAVLRAARSRGVASAEEAARLAGAEPSLAPVYAAALASAGLARARAPPRASCPAEACARCPLRLFCPAPSTSRRGG